MKFEVGQQVELSKEGHRVLGSLGRSDKPRLDGEVLGAARNYADCYRVKWNTRKTAETVHQKFLKPVTAYKSFSSRSRHRSVMKEIIAWSLIVSAAFMTMLALGGAQVNWPW